MFGSWSAAGDRKTRPVTLLEGLEAGAPKGTSVAYAKGASYAFEDAGKSDGFADAIALAPNSAVIIAAMGARGDMTGAAARPEERSVGKDGAGACRIGWAPAHKKKKISK